MRFGIGRILSAPHAEHGVDFLDTCVMWAFEYHKPIMHAELQEAAAKTAAGRWRDTLQGITGDRMQGPGAVRIGGDRDGMEVVLEAGETINNKSNRTRMRAGGRPKQRWLWGAAEEQGDDRLKFRAMGRAEDAIHGRPRGAQEMRRASEASGIHRGSHIVHDGRRATVAIPGIS